MSHVISICLSKLTYWYDATRVQAWPSILVKVPKNEIFPSLTEFGRRIWTDRMIDPDHLGDYDYIRNFPGLERKSDRLVLKGLGLLERFKDGYRLSEQNHINDANRQWYESFRIS